AAHRRAYDRRDDHRPAPFDARDPGGVRPDAQAPTVNLWLNAALLGAAYVAFFLLERALPLRRPKASLPYRVLVNIALSATAFATTAFLVEPAANATLGYSDAGSIGLIPLLGLGDAAGIVAAFLLLD